MRSWPFLAVLILLSACRGDEELPGPSATTPVILISIDTLRSDHLPAYGYDKVQTPHLDALRRESVLYSRAYSHCPLTVPSHATVFTGRLPAETGMRDNTGYTLAADGATLAELLSARGYATGAAVSAYVLRKGRGLDRGFGFWDDEIRTVASTSNLFAQREGAETIAAAETWITANKGRPLFFFLHLYEPHSPYDPPEPYRSRYTPYDGEIARADELVGRFLQHLKTDGLYDRALIILFSDHGEGLNDHGEDEHGIFLYREALQVPLIVKLPESARAGDTVETPVQLSDIFPTVLAQTRTSHELQTASGARSLLAGHDAPRAIYSETYFPKLHFGWSDMHSLIVGEHHFIEAPQRELYDLLRDPGETKNVLEEKRRVVASMRRTIEPLIRSAETPQPIDPEEAAKLAALGYLGNAGVTEGPLPDPKTKRQTFREIREAFKLFRAGKYDEALAFYSRLLLDNPRMFDLWDISARAHMNMGRSREAISAAKEGLKISPQSTHLALFIANAALESGELSEARQHAQLGIRTHAAEAHEVLARIALAEGDIAAAEQEARLTLQAEPRSVRAALILGRIEKEKGNLEAALAHADRAAGMRRDANVRGLHQLRGDLLARLGRTEEAEAALREEVRWFPEHFQAYTNLILLYVADGRLEEATRVIHDLEKASPTPPSYVAISETLRIVGDARGARFWALRGLKRFPSDRSLKRLVG